MSLCKDTENHWNSHFVAFDFDISPTSWCALALSINFRFGIMGKEIERPVILQNYFRQWYYFKIKLNQLSIRIIDLISNLFSSNEQKLEIYPKKIIRFSGFSFRTCCLLTLKYPGYMVVRVICPLLTIFFWRKNTWRNTSYTTYKVIVIW